MLLTEAMGLELDAPLTGGSEAADGTSDTVGYPSRPDVTGGMGKSEEVEAAYPLGTSTELDELLVAATGDIMDTMVPSDATYGSDELYTDALSLGICDGEDAEVLAPPYCEASVSVEEEKTLTVTVIEELGLVIDAVVIAGYDPGLSVEVDRGKLDVTL